MYFQDELKQVLADMLGEYDELKAEFEEGSQDLQDTSEGLINKYAVYLKTNKRLVSQVK